MATTYIRGYYLSYDVGNGYIWVASNSDQKTESYLPPFPTESEANEAFNTQGLPLRMNASFNNCENLKAAPKMPDRAEMNNILTSQSTFRMCKSLRSAPKLPQFANSTNKRLVSCFDGCAALLQAPVLPSGVENTRYMFNDCSNLMAPVSLPGSATNVSYMYKNAVNLSGDMIIRSTPTSYTEMLLGTTKPITIYGDRSVCEAIAATATNGNATWAPWYAPTPAVTNRGQGSYTTADDLTRMVRNGALAVSSYAPGRMVYRQGDIVRADEWEALVEAAQTIDPTVTLSTHYTNLNKIEKAFDDAL